MSSKARTPPQTSPAEVMASVDESASGEQLVIADISRDDAFLSAALEDALALPEWR